MKKAFKKMNPKGIIKRKKHKDGGESSEMNGTDEVEDQNLSSQPSRSGSPAMAPPGYYPQGVVGMMPGSRPGSPPLQYPGVKMMSGPPPPGMKIMNGPPPQGVKMMSGPPPAGVKMMSGPPPAGMKMMSGPPPAGAKLMHGPPPSGVKMMSRPSSPPLAAGGMPFKTMPGMPPGAKMMSGPPPPGAHLVSSRPASPGGSLMSGSLPPGAKLMQGPPPNGVKIMHGPPPAGMKIMKGPPPGMAVKSPSRAPSPNLETSLSFHAGSAPAGGVIPQLVKSPPGGKLMMKSPPRTMSPSGPKMPNFSKGPATAEGNGTLIKPAPQRPVASLQQSVASLGSDDFVFEEEGKPAADTTAEVAAAPAKHTPTPPAEAAHSVVSDTEESTVFREDMDEATAAPTPVPKKALERSKSGNSSLQSSVPPKTSAQKEKDDKDESRRHRRKKEKSKHRKHRKSSRSHKERSSSTSSSSSSTSKDSQPIAATKAAASWENNGEAALFPEAALVPMALTTGLRNKIAEQFLSILCPQQYYGRVKRINNIRPIRADRAKATGLRSNNSIFVATKGGMPNPYFYPQLRLEESDGHAAHSDKEAGAMDTPIILYEAAPGIMLFAETELEARRVLAESENASSCFVLDCSSILFKDPEHYVLPVAMLNVRWVPYSTPFSEPQCPIHKKELQLFDPYSKELVCALCANNTDTNKSKLVVIPDVLGGDSRRRIQESVARQLDDSQRNAKLWLGQHQRIAKVADDRKEAINQQFDFFLSIVEAKRKQFLESCDAEFGLALSDVAREILLSDEKVQLLSAASDHLRTEATKPLYSMQIATIAEALEASDKYHNSFDKTNLQLPVSTQSLPNLESAIGAVQLLSPFPTQQVGTPSNKRKPRTNGITNSPYNVSNEVVFEPKKKTAGRKTQDSPALPSQQTDLDGGPNDMEGEEDQPSSRQRRGHNTTRRRQSTPPLKARGTLVATTPTRSAPTPPAKSPRSMKKKITRSEAKELYASNVLSVPNSTGTSLFDYAINDLFEECDNTSSRSQRGLCVEWTFRVEDPGDWVGIGVGVGSTIEQWEQGRRNDLAHLWIVPYSSAKQTYLLRVTVNPNTGHARLSIHDTRGRQLDDGNVPQWNSSRVCYPQVTFGGHVGKVRMTEIPHLL